MKWISAKTRHPNMKQKVIAKNETNVFSGVYNLEWGTVTVLDGTLMMEVMFTHYMPIEALDIFEEDIESEKS
jgi:hypothetical protein